MVVVEKHCKVIGQSGHSVEVRPFSSDCDLLQNVLIVDAILAYDCPYSGKTALLVVQNALHVPSMDHNLLPPFVLCEAGLHVNEVLKIQVNDPTHEDHSIYCPTTTSRFLYN